MSYFVLKNILERFSLVSKMPIICWMIFVDCDKNAVGVISRKKMWQVDATLWSFLCFFGKRFVTRKNSWSVKFVLLRWTNIEFKLPFFIGSGRWCHILLRAFWIKCMLWQTLLKPLPHPGLIHLSRIASYRIFQWNKTAVLWIKTFGRNLIKAQPSSSNC